MNAGRGIFARAPTAPNVVCEVGVATRFRLRFLLQEFDLARGATLIGRSAECHVTIEDPLVSRQHAKIVISGDIPVLEDLGSRNGVKLNGSVLKGPTRLKDGDRLRIGTQELVFCEVAVGTTSIAKTTGFLRYCASCRLPYPQELAACPACGATEQTDDETLSGQFGTSSRQASWSVQLLVEVTEKALSRGRTSDAERMLHRARAQLEERVASGGPIELDQVEMLSRAAMRVALAAEDPGWARWGIELYGELRFFPSSAVIDAVGEVGKKYASHLTKPAEDLLASLRERVQDNANATDFERKAATQWGELVASLVSLGDVRHDETPPGGAEVPAAEDAQDPVNPDLP